MQDVVTFEEIVEKIVVLKNVSYSEAKNMVEDYLKSHENAYMYEMHIVS